MTRRCGLIWLQNHSDGLVSGSVSRPNFKGTLRMTGALARCQSPFAPQFSYRLPSITFDHDRWILNGIFTCKTKVMVHMAPNADSPNYSVVYKNGGRYIT